VYLKRRLSCGVFAWKGTDVMMYLVQSGGIDELMLFVFLRVDATDGFTKIRTVLYNLEVNLNV
jgi:hypothetical protein